MDKTGTLTRGQPVVTDVEALAGHDRASVLQLAASVEQGSEHPLARAVLDAAAADGLALAAVDDFRVEAGHGVAARLRGGQALRLGTPDWIGADEALREQATRLAAAGRTVVVLEVDGRPAGLIGMADALRETSPAAVRRLRQMGVDVIMLTGDNAATARAIAAQAGIERFEAQVLPADKARIVEGLRREGRVVAMAGDGVNDAPALACADVGFAMGAGSDVAIETAEITLMQSDLSSVADAIDLSRKTMKKIRQNLFFAFIYNVLGIPLAAIGLLSPVIAGAAMAASSVSVVSNSLLLRRWTRQPR